MSVILYILIAAFGIGFLILAHEFGHFIVAKLANVKVERFAIGFGPEIIGFGRGETRYSLRVLPIGGYVKMLGDEPGTDEAEAGRSFLAQPFSKKAAIIAAGSVANVLLSLVLFVAVFQIGVLLVEAKVGYVDVGQPAYYAGLETGDTIVSIDGTSDVDFSDLMVAVALADPGDPVVLEIERDGERMTRTVYPVFDLVNQANRIGISPYETLTVAALIRVRENDEDPGTDGPAAQAGLEPGWTLEAFNGERLESWYDYERRLTRNGMAPYALMASRDGQQKTFNIEPVRSKYPVLGIRRAAADVKEVKDSSLAHEMGLAAGDRILGLGTAVITNEDDIQYALAQRLGDPPPLIIERAGRKLELTWPRSPRNTGEFMTGFDLVAETRISGVAPLSAAEMLGILPGDVIVAVDGKEVATFEEMKTCLAESEGDTIAVRWSRDGVEREGAFSPVYTDMAPKTEGRIWKRGFFGACQIGMRKAWDFASQIYRILKKIVTGQTAIVKNLMGPVSIARVSYQSAAQRSPTQFMLLLAIISINLGVVNLLPIPILDGGHLAVFLIEKIKGSPIPVKTQVVIQYMGLAMIVTIFIFITYQDILRLFR